MKKTLLSAATAMALLLASCNSGGCKNVPQGIVIETDSIYMPNDSTVADAQTFIFEGTSPMNGNAVADVVLAIKIGRAHV